MPTGLVVSLYDKESQILTLCCTICGAATFIDLSPLDDEEEAAIELDHRNWCFVDLTAEDKMN
jgi:hypothetical protein